MTPPASSDAMEEADPLNTGRKGHGASATNHVEEIGIAGGVGDCRSNEKSEFFTLVARRVVEGVFGSECQGARTVGSFDDRSAHLCGHPQRYQPIFVCRMNASRWALGRKVAER